jgi:tetratricopeptide (TPR) repeat protein
VIENFSESLGLKSICEVINDNIGAKTPPELVLSLPLQSISLDLSPGAADEPLYDLVIYRGFCNLEPTSDFPPPHLIKEELRSLITLAKKAVILLYPSKAPFLIKDLHDAELTGFSLEGFLPHRYPQTSHDHDETSTGDFYFFQNTYNSSPLPLPFGITGGPSKLSPIVATDIEEENPDGILKSLQGFTAKGLLAEALPYIYKLISLRPNEERIKINLALNLALLGEGLEAERILKGVLCENPRNHSARISLTKLYLAQEDYENLRAYLPELLLLEKMDPLITQRWKEIRKGLKDLEIYG